MEARPAAGGTTERRQHYADRAVEVAHAFARPPADKSPQQWWRQLEAMLAPHVRADYVGINPARIGYATVTGAPHFQQRRGVALEDAAVVWIPTDSGHVVVELITDASGVWAARITEERP